jgi:hypothetical protein
MSRYANPAFSSPIPPHVSSSSNLSFPRKNNSSTCSSYSCPSSTSSNNSNNKNNSPSISPITAFSPVTFDLVYAQMPTSHPTNDPSNQDFEFDDLFTFTSQSNSRLSPQPSSSSSSHVTTGSSKRTATPLVAPHPQPQRRNWSRFSFSHYVAPELSSTATTTITHQPTNSTSTRPPLKQRLGSSGHRR